MHVKIMENNKTDDQNRNEQSYKSAERQSPNPAVMKDADNTTGENAMGSGSAANNSDTGEKDRELSGDE